MKKLFFALLLCALCAFALSACHRQPAPDASRMDRGAATPTAVPEEGSHGEQDQSKALETMPTLEPVEAIGTDDGPVGDGSAASDMYFSVDDLINQASEFDTYEESEPTQARGAGYSIDPSTYQYSALIDTSLGFTFNYPSHWESVPGVHTVCFREKVEDGDFPARVAITAKKLVHSPEGTVLTDELTSYMRMVYKQYEPDSFQVGTPNSEDVFMGKPGYSNTYLAYSGETEVKGFIIGRAVKRTLYVFHFCATYEDYAAMEGMMRYMLKSVELVEQD